MRAPTPTSRTAARRRARARPRGRGQAVLAAALLEHHRRRCPRARSSCDSISPAGPAPTIATWVRSGTPPPLRRRRRSSGRHPAGGCRSAGRRPPARATSVARSASDSSAEHRVGGVRLGLVGEVEARREALQQPAREHADGEVRRLQAAVGARAPARASPSRSRTCRRRPCPSAAETVRSPARRRSGPPASACQVSIMPSGTGSPAPSSSRPRITIAPGCSRGTISARSASPTQPDVQVRPDRLRAGQRDAQSSSGSPASGCGRRRRCRTGSRAPSRARSASRSNSTPAASRAPARTDWKIGSIASSGSPGKYICVTSRSVKARPNSEKWMWFGRHAFGWLGHGYAPGLIVTNR